MRPSFQSIFANLATSLAERSTCRRLHVGCVITSEDSRQVYALGYNGNATHLQNDCDRTGPDSVGNCGCIHAEANAVVNCNQPRSAKKIVYVTHLPCPMCSKLLINLGGVIRVHYLNDYRVREGLVYFNEVGILHTHGVV